MNQPANGRLPGRGKNVGRTGLRLAAYGRAATPYLQRVEDHVLSFKARVDWVGLSLGEAQSRVG